MQRVVPTLRILDYETAKVFYAEKLGFEILWEHRFEPNFPVFMEIVRDGMSIYLSEHTGDCEPGGLVHLFVDDVDAWYREFKDEGVDVREAPNEDLPGLRMMTVVDPGGNQLRFCTRLG